MHKKRDFKHSFELIAATEQSHTGTKPNEALRKIVCAIAQQMAKQDLKALVDINQKSANDERWNE